MPSGGWGRGEPCASVSFMGTIHDDGPGPDSVPAYVCTPLSRSSIQLNDLKGRASEKGKQRQFSGVTC
jgi:hypothetical protein